jgi:hypothetical protein
MSDTRIIRSIQLKHENSGAIAATAVTHNHRIVPLFHFYPDWVSFTEGDFIGRSVSWAQRNFIYRMKQARLPII